MEHAHKHALSHEDTLRHSSIDIDGIQPRESHGSRDGDEDDTLLAHASRSSPRSTTARRSLVLVGLAMMGLMTLAILGLTVAVVVVGRHGWGQSPVPKFKPAYVLSPENTCGTSGPLNTQITFARDVDFYDFSPASDHVWRERMGGTHGVIGVYGVGYFHQMHCLISIRKLVQALILSNGSYVTSFDQVQGSPFEKRRGDGDSGFEGIYITRDARDGVDGSVFLPERHIAHCFDYLRQVIECFADDSLEPPVHILENGDSIVNGYSPHMCRVKERLYDLLWAVNSAPDCVKEPEHCPSEFTK